MKKIPVLIVDDEKNIRLTMETCLSAAGYTVDLAENGEEALNKVRSSTYDLIFLDMKMPGMNGMEVLGRLKTQYPAQNVVMMTAYGTIESAVAAMKLGAVDYLRKPFTPDELKETAALMIKRAELDTTSARDYVSMVELGKRFIVEQDYPAAGTWLQKAVALDTAKPEAYNLLGVLYEMADELALAQKMYRAALSVAPSYTPASLNLHRTVEWYYTKEGVSLVDSIQME